MKDAAEDDVLYHELQAVHMIEGSTARKDADAHPGPSRTGGESGRARFPPPDDIRRAPHCEVSPSSLECLLVGDCEGARFLGACLAIGATSSVIGRKQTNACARLSGAPVECPAQLPGLYNIGGTDSPSVGTINKRTGWRPHALLRAGPRARVSTGRGGVFAGAGWAPQAVDRLLFPFLDIIC